MKKGLIIFIFVFFAFSFQGCFDSREIDDLAYVIAIGLDKGNNNDLKMTLQVAVPKEIGGQEGGDGGEKSTTIVTIETPSIYSGLNSTNEFLSRQINLSHAKLIVFSEELAKEGLEEYFHAIVRSREFRPQMYVTISRDEAEEFIRNVKPELEISSSKYYELLFKNSNYTALTAATRIYDLYLDSEATDRQGVAILSGVNKFEKSEDISIKNSTYKEKDRDYPLEGDFKAGDIPRISENKAEIMGLAVFDGARMVGELDGEETSFLLMLKGEFNYAYFTIKDPISKDKKIVLNVKKSREPIRNVEMIGDEVLIDVKIPLECDIVSIQSGINYEQGEETKILEEYIAKFFKDGIDKLLSKTQKEFGTDIVGFGQKVKRSFLTWSDWENFNWLVKYKYSKINTEVYISIRRSGLMLESSKTLGKSEGSE